MPKPSPMQLLKQARDNEKFFMEAIPIYCRQLFLKYKGLKDSGFTEEEAFKIILQHGQELK